MAFQIAIGPNIRKSPYFDATVTDGVQTFSVYNHMLIPGNFGDPEAEYNRLINGVVMWDVAVQRQVEIVGHDAEKLVRYLTSRNLSTIKTGQGKYIPLCDHNGILINDPVLLKLSEQRYWLSIADSDICLWAKSIAAERGLEVRVFEPDVSPMAVQGPKAEKVIADLFGDWIQDLKYFWFKETDLDGIPLLLSRSGWSKQGGYELYLQDSTRATELWQRVKEAGKPHGIGPGAPNNVERIESGLLSYGADADEQTNPFEAGLGSLIDLSQEIDFIGKRALQKIKNEGIKRRRVGLLLSGDKIDPNPHPLPIILNGVRVGTMIETAYSPRIGNNVALAMISSAIDDSELGLTVDFETEIRTARITSLPFC